MRRLTGPSAALSTILALATAVGMTVPALASPPPQAPQPAVVTRTAYVNPVSRTFADTFADPSLIRAKDGYWYAYGTSDPLRAGEGTPHRIPIARSSDLVTWSHVGDAFNDATLPSWAAPDAGLWAPDIRYVDGQYRLYYVVTSTTVTAEPNDNAIGMATAPTPAGPWKDSGAPVVGPRRGTGGSGDFLWTFDPSVVTNTDGSQWMFYGSYYGGVFVQQLSADGRSRVGPPTRVAIDNKFEGSYAVHRGGYWYLFASTANCCAGPTTGYSVQVGRARSITGPYVDRQGVPLNTSRAGGTPTLAQNGNAWIGAGHNAIATDLAGQDWIVYHAINRADPYLDGTAGINQRPMLMDRLDWISGWPAVRAGRGPSAGRQPGPATGGHVTGSRAKGLRLQSVRVEADLRSSGAAYGLSATVGSSGVQVLLDPVRGTVRLRQVQHERVLASTTRRLPAHFPAAVWHSLTLEIRSGRAEASVSNARLGDPVALATLRIRGGGRVTSAGALARRSGVAVANLSVLPAAKPVTRLAATPVPHRLDRALSDEFNGSNLAGWSWVRPDAQATVASGVLRWPTENADLTGPGNNAGVLLRSPGAGSWTAETKVTTDLGTNSIRNYQQAGLVAYVNDDLFTRFDTVAIWDTRQTEFGKEMPYAGGLSYGGTIVGPPARTTWLRLTHRVDPANGEHEIRAWSSRDGRTWVKGGVWTLPAGSSVQVGLVSHGGAGATAQFDYFRLYR